MVEVAHEALLRTWPSLTRWLDQDAEALKLLEAVQRAAHEWSRVADASNREAWLVHTGERLVAAEAMRQRPDFSGLLGETGQAYLDACRARDDRVRREKEDRDEAERLTQRRELEQALALAETQRQRADEQAKARKQQRRLSWFLAVLVGLSIAASFFAIIQSGIAKRERLAAVEQERKTAAALAETERELLRAKTAELRAMIGRLDTLKANAQKESRSDDIESLEREQLDLTKQLDKTANLHRQMLAKAMGFRGDLDFLMKMEGNVGGVKLLSSGFVWIDPATILNQTDQDTLKKRYDFLLTPVELSALLALSKKSGEEAKSIYKKYKYILDRIHLNSTDVAQLVPEAAEPIWTRLLKKHPILGEETTPRSVHTAVLSFAFNMGPVWLDKAPLSSAIERGDWLQLADGIQAFDQVNSFKNCRNLEAN